MQKVVFTILAVVSLSCASNIRFANHAEVIPNAQARESVEPKQRPSDVTPTDVTPMPRVASISEGTVSRRSNKQDKEMNYLPPWTRAEVVNVFFKKRPAAGEFVTIVPLGVNIKPIDLKIVKAKRCEQVVENSPPQCEVELAPVTQREFFNMQPLANRKSEYPFDVLVLYPRASNARALSKSELRREMLPQGVTPNVVFAAIDLTNDGMPDVLVTRFCCGEPSKSAENCDNTCGKTRIREGKSWKVVDTLTPA